MVLSEIFFLQYQNALTNTGPSNLMLFTAVAVGLVGFYIIIRYNVKDSPIFIPGLVKLTNDYRMILEKKFTYYQRLSPENKRQFEKRVHLFINSKIFIPRRFKKVTMEMKTMVAASAVQLTFGFQALTMPHFTRILIYPDSYYSSIRKTYHKGEVNPSARLIVFSWKGFLEGYEDNSDSSNLGLHEMAHALKLENKIFNNEVGFLDPILYHKWEVLATKHVARLKTEEDPLFRKYAAENEYEFFAVAVENFFERPFLFQKIHPELFELLKGLLNQDPIAIQQLEPEEEGQNS